MKDGSAIAGATDSTIRAGASGRYAVVITANSSGPGANSCADTSAADTVIVHPLPVPVITAQNGVLSTAGTYSTYQWFFNGIAITGALSQSFTPVVNGSYTVTVTDANGCTGTSAVYPVTGLAVTNVASSSISVRLYPNPVKDLLLIDSPVPVDLQIRSVDGRIVAASKQTKSISTSCLVDGIYIVQVRNAEGLLLRTVKIVKRSH